MINFLFTKTPLAFFVESFWRDEAFSYLLSRRSIFEILALTARDFSPPLYYLVLHFYIKIAGASEMALRLPSLFFYLGTIYISFLFLNEVLKISSIKSFLYVILVTVNPVLLIYAFETRMYTMFAFFTMLSFYALATKRNRLLLVSNILGLYTQYFMLVVIGMQLLFTKFKKKELYLSLMFFAPWFLFMLTQKVGNQGAFWIPKVTLHELLYLPSVLLTGYELNYGMLTANKWGYFVPLIIYSLVLIAIFGLGAFFYFKKQNKKTKTILSLLMLWSLGSALLVFFISFVQPLYIPRYLIFSTVGYILLFIFLIDQMPKFLKIIAWILVLKTSFTFINYHLAYNYKPDIRKTFYEIKKLAAKDDIVYVTSELDYFTAQYYFDENRVYIYGKTYQEIPQYVGKVLIPESAIVTKYPMYPKKAFVITSADSYEIRAIY